MMGQLCDWLPTSGWQEEYFLDEMLGISATLQKRVFVHRFVLLLRPDFAVTSSFLQQTLHVDHSSWILYHQIFHIVSNK